MPTRERGSKVVRGDIMRSRTTNTKRREIRDRDRRISEWMHVIGTDLKLESQRREQQRVHRDKTGGTQNDRLVERVDRTTE